MITIDAPIREHDTLLCLVWAGSVQVGELVYSPTEREHHVGAMLPGWTAHVYAASDGRMIPDITRAFVTGLSSRRAATRAALAQLDANDRWAAKTFVYFVPRTDHTERLLRDLKSPQWRLALPALFLIAGHYMPDEAKRNGASFGFCDGRGQILPAACATHVGWSVAP